MARDRDLLVGNVEALTAASLFGMLGPLARFGADTGVSGAAFTANASSDQRSVSGATKYTQKA